MGQDDSLNASLAHIILGCVAGNGISRMSGKSFTHPGMHANFFIHSILGFLHYQSGTFNSDFGPVYTLSYKATRYLALPCLMADIHHANKNLAAIHLVSGLIPFALALAGSENVELGNLMIACNILSLCHYSLDKGNEWGWYTAASGLVAYYLARREGGPKLIYPLALAMMEYCAYRVFHVVWDAPDPNQRRRQQQLAACKPARRFENNIRRCDAETACAGPSPRARACAPWSSARVAGVCRERCP